MHELDLMVKAQTKTQLAQSRGTAVHQECLKLIGDALQEQCVCLTTLCAQVAICMEICSVVC